MLLVQGTNVPDENGSLEPLRKYTEKTLVIVLPGELTIFDIGLTFLALFLAPSRLIFRDGVPYWHGS